MIGARKVGAVLRCLLAAVLCVGDDDDGKHIVDTSLYSFTARREGGDRPLGGPVPVGLGQLLAALGAAARLLEAIPAAHAVAVALVALVHLALGQRHADGALQSLLHIARARGKAKVIQGVDFLGNDAVEDLAYYAWLACAHPCCNDNAGTVTRLTHLGRRALCQLLLQWVDFGTQALRSGGGGGGGTLVGLWHESCDFVV